MDQYEQNLKLTPENKRKISWEIIRELSMHASKEEMVVYPDVRTKLPNGEAVADHALDEHQELKELLYRLDGMDDPNHAEFDQLMRHISKTLRHHIREEEEDFLPKFAKTVGDERLRTLADQWEAARAAAPTRPHPAAPNRPPLNMAANATAVPLDMAKDAVRFGLSSKP
eukprot:jgi/Chrzof1/673/Cz01g24190.t1